ncbi:MAG: pyridoxamine 5'-phosphate oxidase family protein [Acidimicrobiales bacterium]
MELDRNGLEVLSREECLQLLAGSVVGRVVVTDRALPAAFPVNFTLFDDDVVFLSSEGSKLEAVSTGQVVAFEVDEIDPRSQTGWSVLIQGWAGLIEDPEELERARALGLQPWAPRPPGQFVRIRAELVSGRRLLPPGPVRIDHRLEAAVVS